MKLSKLFLCALSSLVGAISNPAVSAALGAKTGTITSPSGSDANMRTLGDVQPATGTLAGVVRAALQLAAAVKAVVINFGTGQAVVTPTGAGAPNGMTLVGTLTRDSAEASSSWTLSDNTVEPEIDAKVIGVIQAQKPRLSVESLTNKLEDIDAELVEEEVDLRLVVHYDQATPGVIQLYSEAAATVEAYDPAMQYAEDAAYERAVVAAGATQFGE